MVLLNTDTEVPPGWLERLMRPILGEPRVASATPFSNSAAMFGFPIPNMVNPLPAGLGVDELDAAFARLSPAYDPSLVAPTGVGFCMGVNLAAWQALGPFDAATFGRGYGEETDWCLRAAAAGWRNVLVPNLFVYHADGGTFGNAEKRAILDIHLRNLHRRWPTYHRTLASFRRLDPWAVRRSAAVIALATALDAEPLVLADPAAAEAELALRTEETLALGRAVVRLARRQARGPLLIEICRANCSTTIQAPSSYDSLQLATLLQGFMQPPAVEAYTLSRS